MTSLVLLVLIGAAYAVPFKAPLGANRIVGGETTTVNQYPYMANMQWNWWGSLWFQSCGGSLITTKSVLSAAHCYYGDRASDWRVVLGSSYPSSGGTTINVAQLIIHPEYNSNTVNNDVAIVGLSSPAILSESIGLASIAGPNYNLADGTRITAIGFGNLWANGPSPDQLQRVDIDVINQNICAERYAYLKTLPGYANWPDITKNMLCAGILNSGGKDACQGDSGGPIAHNNNIIVGITSWGFGCADEFYPGVNARVSEYTSWIESNA